MMKCSLLLLPLLITTTISSRVLAAKDDVVERSLLLEFYEATGGPSWNDNRGWEEANASGSNYCDWHGVICVGEADLDTFNHRQLNQRQLNTEFVLEDQDENYKVIGLDLKDNFLTGRTPSSLWKLPLLQYLNLNQNPQLTIDFSSVANAVQLSIVKIQFTATSSLTGLEHANSNTLNVLQMSGCPFDGQEFPKELLALTNLRDLQLAKCQLHGQLPGNDNINPLSATAGSGTLSGTDLGLATLSNLRELNLFDNNLKGSIPNSLIALTRIEKISFSRNQLTGSLHVVDAWTNLQQLYMAENQFDGTLPTLSQAQRLNKVYLNQNSLSGTIPTNFLVGTLDWDPNYDTDNRNNAPPTIVVDLSQNQLTGEIPNSLADFEDFNMDFHLSQNLFTNISQDLCFNKKNWNNGAINDYGCDGLVCPPGSYSALSGHASQQYACHVCESNIDLFGQTMCVQENDKSALLALYEATNGDEWYNNTGWNYFASNAASKNANDWDDDTDVCSWYGIECWDDNYSDNYRSTTGRVRVIKLENNNLVGTMPEDLVTMEYLHTINVARNPDLVVPLQQMEEAGQQLRHLDISQTSTVDFNGFEHSPSWFAYLIADGLQLGGTLPTQILNVTSLKLLSLAECELIGPLPAALGDLINLNELYLYDNHLRGPIPAQISTMKSLRMISLAQNQLTGSLPHSALDELSNLEAFSISDQISKGGGITGSLTTFRFHPFLKSLQLSKNLLEGTIPVQLLEGTESLQDVLKVNLAYNRLTGIVPGGLGRFPRLDLELQGNRFTGIDDRLCNNDDWMNGLVKEYRCNAILCPVGTSGGRQMFDYSPCQECPELSEEDDDAAAATSNKWMGQEHCQMEFSIDETDEQGLIELLFRRTKGDQWVNNRNWLVPNNKAVHVCDWYGISCDESKSIVSITLGSNNLQGTFPTEIYMLPKLELLSLFGNTKLEISMEGIDNAHKLRSLVLDHTGLSSLEGIGQARSLTELNVQNNDLKGTLPEELGRLINLKALSISKNSLQGPVPFWLNNLPALETFLASDNNFGGTLPDFSSFKRIAYIDLSDNNLSGEIPLNFLKSVPAEDKIVVDLSNNRMEGAVPRELVRLERMTIHLKNNKIDKIDRELCNANGWNDFDVEKFGCDGILCPAGTSSKTGRQTSVTATCTQCSQAKYMGSTACYASATSSGIALRGNRGIFTIAKTVSTLAALMLALY